MAESNKTKSPRKRENDSDPAQPRPRRRENDSDPAQPLSNETTSTDTSWRVKRSEHNLSTL